jgi:hypothetical protein
MKMKELVENLARSELWKFWMGHSKPSSHAKEAKSWSVPVHILFAWSKRLTVSLSPSIEGIGLHLWSEVWTKEL